MAVTVESDSGEISNIDDFVAVTVNAIHFAASVSKSASDGTADAMKT